MKLEKRFYVGSKNTIENRPDWLHKTIEQAVEHAKEMIMNDPDCEPQYIVQVVAVVRYPDRPVIVERLK